MKKVEDKISKIADYLMLAGDQLGPFRNKSKLKNYFSLGEGSNEFKQGVVCEKIVIAEQSLKKAIKLLRGNQ